MSEHTLDKEGKKTLSYSRMITYLDCPKKYEYTYFSDIPRPLPTFPLFFGTAIHKAIEDDDIAYINTGKRLHLNAVYKIFWETLQKDIKEQNAVMEDGALRLGKIMLKEYRRCLTVEDPQFTPEFLEKEFSVTLSTVPVTIHGFIDCLTKDGWIIDRKTSKSEFKVTMEKKMQLLMYAIWYRKTYKKKEKGLRFDVLRKTITPKAQIIPITYTEKEIQDTVQLLGWVYNQITQRNFPSNPSYKCGWCPYKTICPDSAR